MNCGGGRKRAGGGRGDVAVAMATIYDRINAALVTLGKRKPRSWENEEETPNGAGDAAPGGSREGHPPSKLQHQLLFRPFNQKDLHQRLETFKPLNWFARPDKASAIECAIHGWVNSGRDALTCNFCSVQLRYPQNIAPEHRNTAAELFSQQLLTKHASHCPWRTTHSQRSLLAFKPPADAQERSELLQRFQQRCQHLQQVELLPNLTPAVLQHMQEADPAAFAHTVLQGRSLAPPPAPIGQTPGAEPLHADPAPEHHHAPAASLKITNPERARMLALLGWDMEVLSSEPGGASLLSRPDPGQYSLLHLTGARQQQQQRKQQQQQQQRVQQQSLVSAASALLHCPECKARVGLWNFTGPQPPPIGRLTFAAAAKPPPPSAPGSPAHPTLNPASSPLTAAAPVAAALSLTIAGGSFGSTSGSGSGFGAAAAGSGPFGRPQGGASVFGRPGRSQPQTPGPSQAHTPAPPSGSLKRRDPDSSALSPSAAAPDAQHLPTTKRPCLQPGASTPAASPSPSPLQTALGLLSHWSTPARATSSTTPPPRLNPLASAAERATTDVFDALGHHRAWCPWTYTGGHAGGPPPPSAGPASPRSPHAAAGSGLSPAPARAAGRKGAGGEPGGAEAGVVGWLCLMQLAAGAEVAEVAAGAGEQRGREAEAGGGEAGPSEAGGEKEGAGGAGGSSSSRGTTIMQGVVQGMKEVLRRR